MFGDVALEHIDKVQAIQELAEYLLINKSHIISFGDAQVDIPMFQCSGLSICMGNGREAAKAHADYITDTVENDGVYKALQHFQIIGENI